MGYNQAMALLFYIIIFIFGTIVGSFLNCIIFRMEKDESFISGRSKCMHCGQELGWKDLFPIFSFLFLAGKCRYCQKKISIQYPLVEIFTGVLFILIPLILEFNWFQGLSFFEFLTIIYYWTIASFFIIIFVYDFRHYLVPDSVVYSGIGLSFLYNLFKIWNAGFGYSDALPNIIFAILAGAGIFLLIFLISRGKWIGFGDVKLGLFMGLFLGWLNIIIALFLGVFFGAIIGLALIFLGKKKISSEIPFGPFLITGTFIAFFWGSQIISWYFNLIL
jgi:prepilin signal peptidase PulO-like enzyme (type II secretory pathway)